MPENDTHMVEFGLLEERVKQLETNGLIQKTSEAPTYLLLRHHFYAEDDAIRDSITDGSNDCGIDAVYIERSREQPLIHIIQSKYHSSVRKSRAGFKSNSLEKIVRFFQIIKDRELDLSKIANAYLEQKIIEIRDLTDRDFPEFKVWLISNGKKCIDHEVAPLREKIRKDGHKFEEFHLHEFVEFCVNRRRTRTDHIFRTRETGVLDYGPSELKSVVGFISAKELYSLLKDLRDEQKIDYSLFDMNIRGFLGLDNSINKEIFKSAVSRQNIYFSSLNNGITIVASSFKVMRMDDAPKIGVKNMSIVNGAQTCSAIFDSMKDLYPNFEQFDQLSVLFRLFATEDRDLIEKISLTTNSQSRVNPRDLKANDHLQIELEQKLLEKGIQYIRKRGDLGREAGELPVLDAMKAGQILLAYVLLEPANAKRNSDEIFSDYYGKIFANVDVNKLVEAHRIFTKIETMRDSITDDIRIRGVNRTENTFVTYGAFHLLALVSILKQQDSDISDDAAIDEAVEIVAKTLISNNNPAYYSFFRNPEMSRVMIANAREPDLFDRIKS